ncbi:MAG: Arc family DNA-binding protein [Comamonas sp.]|nr:Arc family DNA-binding protein [Comamonas sp.]
MDDERYTRITLRIPKELHAKLQDAADATSKSMNAEIIGRLEGTFAIPAPSLQTQSREAELLRDELVAIVGRKRKNEEILDYLRSAGLPTTDLGEVFAKEWRELGPKALIAAQRLRELGEIEAVKQISKRHPAKGV